MLSAKKQKNDEFYTQRSDIEKELNNYNHLSKHNHFKDAVVFCNCDDPLESNFFKYFADNFTVLGLKKLICTHYEPDENKKSYVLTITRGMDKNSDGKINRKDVEQTEMLFSNGDFRSPECIKFLQESDIVVTNPPFSLFREYVAQLMEYNKKFLIIGNQNAIAYKEFFPLIKENKVWLGCTMNGSNRWFRVPDYYKDSPSTKIGGGTDGFEKGVKYVFAKAVVWFTNLDCQKRHEEFIPRNYKNYYGNESDYHKYDNYDAININNVNDIPIDYYGIMGVPVTFLHKFNPEQFEIIGLGSGDTAKKLGITKNYRGRTDLAITVNNVRSCPYNRLLIRRKKGETDGN
ncbi:MAG: adenine-specific methyltransferase EcoRI family protein [Alphaproteobacteria bacterium]|nr:adenine-specific methyltransferase EcoRI family protein [Alphaproteobacteria bacterium]